MTRKFGELVRPYCDTRVPSLSLPYLGKVVRSLRPDYKAE